MTDLHLAQEKAPVVTPCRHPMFHLSAWSYGDLGPPGRSSIHCFDGGEWDDKWDAFLDSEHSRKCLSCLDIR